MEMKVQHPAVQSHLESTLLYRSKQPEVSVQKEIRPAYTQENQEAGIKHMCLMLGVDEASLLSEDIRSHSEFMQSLAPVSVSYKSVSSALVQWKSGQRRKQMQRSKC